MSAPTPNVPSACSQLVRRVLASNAGPMTGAGTNTYLVGVDDVAVIDPGPDEAAHIDAIVGAAGVDRIRWIVLTHGHPDHAAGAALLAAATNAPVYAPAPRQIDVPASVMLDERVVIEGTEFTLRIQSTPGHTAHHVCIELDEERALFTGDTVLDGMTSVITPDDGDMTQYLDSLECIAAQRLQTIYPGHGNPIANPRTYVRELIAHRLEREAQVLTTVRDGVGRVPDIAALLYPELDEPLRPVAEWQVVAHLRKLRTDGRVAGRDARSVWRVSE